VNLKDRLSSESRTAWSLASHRGANSAKASTSDASSSTGGSLGSGGSGGTLTWPTPDGWKPETLAFPLDFAPDLPYHGEEVLRFAPGFFDPKASDDWSYGFAWWVEEKAPIDGAALTDALTKYFRGLCLAVGAGKFSFDPKHFQTSLSQGGPDDGLPGATYQGQVDSYDAFTTGAPLTLRVRAHVFECPAANHQVVLIGASPAANPAPIWGELSKLLSSFHCG